MLAKWYTHHLRLACHKRQKSAHCAYNRVVSIPTLHGIRTLPPPYRVESSLSSLRLLRYVHWCSLAVSSTSQSYLRCHAALISRFSNTFGTLWSTHLCVDATHKDVLLVKRLGDVSCARKNLSYHKWNRFLHQAGWNIPNYAQLA